MPESQRSESMMQRIAQLLQMGCQFIALLALNDEGAPAFNKEIAHELAGLGIPAFACTPDLFPMHSPKASESKTTANRCPSPEYIQNVGNIFSGKKEARAAGSAEVFLMCADHNQMQPNATNWC